MKRRYLLYQDIQRFPSHLLIFQSYQNHLKNLKIKVLISNFVLLIIFLELINNISYDVGSFLQLLRQFISFKNKYVHRAMVINCSLKMTFVPLLTLFMVILWLVYRKYEYHYTLRRWVWYVILRFISIFVLMTVRIKGNNFGFVCLNPSRHTWGIFVPQANFGVTFYPTWASKEVNVWGKILPHLGK